MKRSGILETKDGEFPVSHLLNVTRGCGLIKRVATPIQTQPARWDQGVRTTASEPVLIYSIRRENSWKGVPPYLLVWLQRPVVRWRCWAERALTGKGGVNIEIPAREKLVRVQGGAGVCN